MLLLAAAEPSPGWTSLAVIAIQQIRRMRGGAQSQLMLASDSNLYVVKFRNNPQHVRVLANELLATRLAAAIGLSVPPSEVIEVSDWRAKGDLRGSDRDPADSTHAGRSPEPLDAGL